MFDLIVCVVIFYMDRKDIQVSDFDVIICDDGMVGFVDIIDNVDLGINKGVELEFSWIVSDVWQFDVSVGYLSVIFEGYMFVDGIEVFE